MKKIILATVAATAVIFGTAACTANVETGSAPQPNAPQYDAPYGLSDGQWYIIEDLGAEYGYTSAETAMLVDSAVIVWEQNPDLANDICDYYYAYGDDATINLITESAMESYYDGTFATEGEMTLYSATEYAIITNNC